MDDEVEAVAKALKEHRINRAECACGMSVWMEDPEDHWATVAVAALDAHRATVPHVITTVEELEALPERTVLLDSEGCVLQVVEFDCPNHGEGDYCVWDGCTGRQRWYDGIGSRSGSEVVYLPATVLTPTPEPTVSDDPIPRYAQLDIWMALFGSEHALAYDTFRDEHGFAETWAQLCAKVRERKPEPTVNSTVDEALDYLDSVCEGMPYDTYLTLHDLIGSLTPEPHVKVCGKFHPQLGTCVRKAGHKKSHRSSYKDGREYFWRDSDEPTVKPDRASDE